MEALFTMPYIFLPDAAWMRRPGEDAPSYHTRVILTLRLMDLLEEENGIWHEAQVTKGFDASAPDWYDEDGDWARGDRLRTAFAQRYSEFDQGDLFDASESVARLSVPASLALWQRDLALHDSAEGRAALEEFMGADTPSTSDELMAGFENGREIVGTLFASLAGLGLEPPDLPDLVNVL
jgi:3-oxoacyl-ACP reductase-like protein